MINQSGLRVKLNQTLAWQSAIFALFLAWPLILFGHPTYLMGDSLSYMKVGKASVAYATEKLHQLSPPEKPVSPHFAGSSKSVVPVSPGNETKTSRSISYSVAAYALRWPGTDMTALALAQIGAASLIAATAVASSGVKRRRIFVLISLVVAIATPLAAYASFATPDIWAGLLIGAIILLLTRLDRLSTAVRLLMSAIIAFAVTAHVSIPPLAVGMTLLGVIALLVGPRFGVPTSPGAWRWLLIPPMLGLAITSALGFVAFGQVSVTGKRIPVALARSVSDGPARWYLEKHCRTEHYAVCEVFGNRIPNTIDGLLFAKNSLTDLATPEQMNRIRAEEPEIVFRAALAYPGTEAYGLTRNIVRQLFRFDLGLTNFQKRVTLDTTGTPQLVPAVHTYPAILHIVELFTNIALALSIGWATWAFRCMQNRERATLVLLAFGLVGNAMICVIFSGIAERYQARVVWLLPLFILGIAMAREKTQSRQSPPVDI